MVTTGKRALQSLINKQRTYGIDMILFHRLFFYIVKQDYGKLPFKLIKQNISSDKDILSELIEN